MSSPAVALDDAVVTRGGFPLLAGVSLRIDRGTLVALRGANGAGKTSVLRLISGLERLRSGAGEVLGIDLLKGDRRELRRRVGWMGHDGSFYEDLTVRENLEFAARALRRPLSDIDSALDTVGLAHRYSTPARQLSAGQRRRMALGWIIVRRPELWLLDEPHAALDQSARDLVDELILDALGVGVTVVISAHDDLGPRLAPQKVVTLSGGRIAGSP